MAEPREDQPDARISRQARQFLKQAEGGSVKAAAQLDSARKADPGGTDAAQQEAAEGPEGRGLAR
jgi:hypothetical protein